MKSTKTYRCSARVIRKLKHTAFPIDMLRYDQCFPVSGEDVAKIERSNTPTLTDKQEDCSDIRLGKFSEKKDGGWTPERWESFGWVLVTEKSPV